MDDCDNSQEDKKIGHLRSPTFSREEVVKLVELVEQHKMILLNKTTNANAIRTKDVAWVKIEKAFNNQGFYHERTVDSLKTKWKNLKKRTFPLIKHDESELKQSQYDPIYFQIRAMLAESDKNELYSTEMPEISDNEEDDIKVARRKNGWDKICKLKQSEDATDDNGSMRERSVNFSPQETKLLIQCVREQKNIILNKSCSVRLRKQAWDRIAHSFNKRSPVERTTKVLHTKFVNMKKKAKLLNLKAYVTDFSRKHEKLVNENTRQIKSEPIFEDKSDVDVDESHDDGFNDIHDVTDTRDRLTPDPLSTVLNGDASAPWAAAESREVVKRKLELLNFQMETAKMERQRIMDAIEAEKRDRETRAIESALRLRAARLEAVAMETRLPPAHPALAFPPQEASARQYATSMEYQM